MADPAKPDTPHSAFPLSASHLWPAGYAGPTLCVSERGTKTSRLQLAPPVLLALDPRDPEPCFPRTLALYTNLADDPSAPPGSAVTETLFRPLHPDRQDFREAPCSSSALGTRMQLRLMLAGDYDGETKHSLRGGSLQHAAAQGASLDALQAPSQLRSGDVLKRYIDTQRHYGARRVHSRGK